MPRYELVDGASSKFWEIDLKGDSFVTTYGKIGTAGQSTTKRFADAAKARKEHEKLVGEKLRKGYKLVGRGRARAGSATPPPAPRPAAPAKAPLLWQFKTKSTAFGIYVDSKLGWVGNEKGEVFAVTHSGKVETKVKLPAGVKCIIADEVWRYAGCNDGSVYDLTGRIPRLVYKVSETASILWLDIFRGNLCVADDEGGLTVVDAEDQLRWQKRDRKDGSGWAVRADGTGVYHGHDRGVAKWSWQGKKLWKTKTEDVLFGWQESDLFYVGTTGDEVITVDKKSGKKKGVCKCDSTVLSCAATPDGRFVFAGDSGFLYCFDADGTRRWKLRSTAGNALSMQYVDGHLYIVTGSGYLACVDTSDEALKRAEQGKNKKPQERRAPAVKAVASTTLETTSDTSKGVVVECRKSQGRIRVHVVSEGYNKTWFCQFPKDIREEGARYVVDQVREATQGGFYRVVGDIKRLS